MPDLSRLPLDYSKEVRDALDKGLPVVALESTIISHGMPWPRNVDTARSVENILRGQDVVPATIAVLNGRIKIGLESAELDYLGKAEDVQKLSRRDLPLAIAGGLNGATTVASTMICAALAGIEVFVTGGIGGVHRGAENSFDISADLEELAQSPVMVVCAGAKSILDLPKTLEVLETKGVPVIGFGTREFPAFYSRASGLMAPLSAHDPEQVAAIWQAQRDLDYPGGALIANPVPVTEEIPSVEIAAVIEEALREAEEAGVKGRDVTPHLLAAIVEKTGGRSLETNIALVENNARVGGAIARALWARRQ